MLRVVGARTRITHEPGLVATIERASGGGVAAAICHYAANDDAGDAFAAEDVAEVGVDEGVVGVFGNDARFVGAGWVAEVC